MEGYLTALVMVGIFTRPSWGGGCAPFAGRWSVSTNALEVCCCARNLIALCSAVSASESSAFLINDDYNQRFVTVSIVSKSSEITLANMMVLQSMSQFPPVSQGTLAFQQVYPLELHLSCSKQDIQLHAAVFQHQYNSHTWKIQSSTSMDRPEHKNKVKTN